MGAVNTIYTFTATDTITSDRMNKIIDETTMTGEAISGGTLQVIGGKLRISSQGVTSNELAANAVTVNAIANGSVTPAKLSTGGPTWDGATFFLSQRAIELGNGITSNIESYVDFHSSVDPLEDFDTRIIREAGKNNEFRIQQTGASPINLQASAGVKISTSSAILMTVTGSGNVGIGTNTPTTRLHLSSSNTESVGGMLLENTSSGGRKFSVASRTDFSGPRFSIADETQQAERFLINASGNVGIGVTPTSRLHVAGGITGESLNVGGGAIRSGAITSSGAVTAPSFVGPLTGNASSATTASTVSNGAITSAKLAANAVTVSAIADGAVTPAKLSTGGPTWDGLTFFLSQRGIELGNGITSDIESLINFCTTPSSGYEARIIRGAGANEEFKIEQTGTSPIKLQASAGVKFADAVMPNPAGTAPIYGVRAWVNFDGATAANIGGTYERVGTTVTVTTTVDHGLIVGHKVFLDFTTGTAVDGAFVVTGVTTSRIFTVTHGTSGSTSGNVTLNRRSIRASGNVANVSRLGAGQYAVNFATALPNENYVRSGFANFPSSLVAGLVGGNSTSTTTAQSCDIYVANSGNGAEFDASLVNVMFIG